MEKSVDGVLGIRTCSRRMVGEDDTTELWLPSFTSESPQCTTHYGWPLELVTFSHNHKQRAAFDNQKLFPLMSIINCFRDV